MTLDIAKFITNSIKNQSKIQHLDINSKTVKIQKIPKSISSVIIEEYGDKYLFDANYVVFFWGKITKDEIKRLFNVVDKALGKSANKLTDKDFKKINIELDTFNDQNVSDIEDDNQNYSQDDQEIDDFDQDESTENIDSENIDNELNEEDDQSKQIKTSYFFLKITTK